jgi:hypothetical protein
MFGDPSTDGTREMDRKLGIGMTELASRERISIMKNLEKSEKLILRLNAEHIFL